ncbi:MAG: hypothetical protein GY761_13465 [Hyphomicrobiales bacterium]|nr:hypothetical protein [Hyphomicrobiales bacterium]
MLNHYLIGMRNMNLGGLAKFFAPIDDGRVSENDEHGWLSWRTEIRCTTCNSYLGQIIVSHPDLPIFDMVYRPCS